MPGIVALNTLLSRMQPELLPEEFVFCSLAGDMCEYTHLDPWAIIGEAEGLTLVLERSKAETAHLESRGICSTGTYRCISLRVHSSLEAVGLTAAITAQLAAQHISANILAGFYHDHLFVPAAQAEHALAALRVLSEEYSQNTTTPPEHHPP